MQTVFLPSGTRSAFLASRYIREISLRGRRRVAPRAAPVARRAEGEVRPDDAASTTASTTRSTTPRRCCGGHRHHRHRPHDAAVVVADDQPRRDPRAARGGAQPPARRAAPGPLDAEGAPGVRHQDPRARPTTSSRPPGPRPSGWCSAPRSCGPPSSGPARSWRRPRATPAAVRHETEDFVDQRLASFEILLDRLPKTVAAGREKLAIGVPARDAPEPDPTRSSATRLLRPGPVTGQLSRARGRCRARCSSTSPSSCADPASRAGRSASRSPSDGLAVARLGRARRRPDRRRRRPREPERRHRRHRPGVGAVGRRVPALPRRRPAARSTCSVQELYQATPRRATTPSPSTATSSTSSRWSREALLLELPAGPAVPPRLRRAVPRVRRRPQRRRLRPPARAARSALGRPRRPAGAASTVRPISR